jgi:simple sugar transport system permease protein
MTTATSTPRPDIIAAVTSYRPTPKLVPVLAILFVFLGMFTVGSFTFEDFASGQVFLNLFVDNAFLLVVAVGVTFVILTGGIDLSVGSVVGPSTMVSAELLQKHGWPAPAVILLVLAIGSLLGFVMGRMIHFFEIQLFVVTLTGLFLARGLCYVISTDSIPIDDETYVWFAQTKIPLPGGMHISPSVVIALVVVAIAVYVLHHTRFGRSVYAVGGGEQSALLMGLALGRTKVAVYTISGFCSALGGIPFAFYLLSGYSLSGAALHRVAPSAQIVVARPRRPARPRRGWRVGPARLRGPAWSSRREHCRCQPSTAGSAEATGGVQREGDPRDSDEPPVPCWPERDPACSGRPRSARGPRYWSRARTGRSSKR